MAALAPLHNAAGLEGVAVAEERFRDAAQVAVFDTAFHAGLAAGGARPTPGRTSGSSAACAATASTASTTSTRRTARRSCSAGRSASCG